MFGLFCVCGCLRMYLCLRHDGTRARVSFEIVSVYVLYIQEECSANAESYDKVVIVFDCSLVPWDIS